MELYSRVSSQIAQLITTEYSTSFGKSTRLFPASIREHIYAIYGLVRIADEVVDTYRGKDVDMVIKELETEVYLALKRNYSPNPVIHAFAITAKKYGITRSLIHPFFLSMNMDLHPVSYTQALYEKYIYGSAEVVGLMCLRVFCNNDEVRYKKLEAGARALGAAYQKVNFLRDMAADYKELGRIYFPGITFETFDEKAKVGIIKDIQKDFIQAEKAIRKLPETSQKAVGMSFVYYSALLDKLEKTPAVVMTQRRIRISNPVKLLLFARAHISRRFTHDV